MSFLASADIRTGTLSVDIFYLEATITGARTGDIVSVGDLKYEFDITDSNTDVNRLFVSFSSIEMSFFQYARDGRDWAQDLISYIGGLSGVDQRVTMTMTLNRPNGQSYKWLFDVYSDAIKIDERTRMVSISFTPYTNSYNTVPLLNFYSSGLNYIHDYINRNSGLLADICMTAGYFIEAVLRQAYAGLGGITFSIESGLIGLGASYSTNTYDKKLSTEPVDNKYYICVRTGSDLPIADRAIDPIRITARLAGVEGGIFGIGHGVGFYFNKLSKANQVTLSYDQLVNLAVSTYSRGVRSVKVTVRNDNTVAGVVVANQTGSSEATYNTYAIRKMDVFFIPDGLVVGEYYAVGKMREGQATQTLNMMNGLADVARLTYGQNFGASGKKSIEFEAFGIDTVKPFNTMKFNTTVPDKYQGILFRPSYLEYSFVRDTVKGRAYEIGTP
jgi:hypothetical protein